MPTSPIVLSLLVLITGICLFAFWKGGMAERIGAVVILANLIVTLVAAKLLPPSVALLIGLVGDGLTAMGLMGIALRFASFWLGAAMLLYGLQFSLHAYYFVTHRPADVFHAMVNNANFVLVSVSLAAGTLMAWRKTASAQA